MKCNNETGVEVCWVRQEFFIIIKKGSVPNIKKVPHCKYKPYPEMGTIWIITKVVGGDFK